MYTLRVKAGKINIRNSPVVDTTYKNWLGDMALGETHAAESLVTGPNGQTFWKDSFNRFSVTEGSAVVSHTDPTTGATALGVTDYLNQRFDGTNLKSPVDYSALLNVPSSLKANKGKGVTVAIMDFSVPDGLSIKNGVKRYRKDPLPTLDFHGAFVAGLIAGNKDILGVSQEVQILDLPMYDESGTPSLEMVNAGLDYLKQIEMPVVLNISQDLQVLDTSGLPARLSALPHVSIVAAGGLDNLTLSGGKMPYPGSSGLAISIGALSDALINATPIPSFSRFLDFVFYNFDFVSFNPPTGFQTQFARAHGESFATAVVSGMCALLLSNAGSNMTQKDLKTALTGLAAPFTDKTSFSFLNPIIPPQK